jgi:hypothetical protein
MQIRHVVIKVNDQDKALAFYTTVLRFVKKLTVPGPIRWLTVCSHRIESTRSLRKTICRQCLCTARQDRYTTGVFA